MSVRLNYESELIEELPVSGEPIHPEEYARLVPLLEEGSKIVYPMKRYIFLLGLYIFFSYNLIDRLLVSVYPSLGIYPLITIGAKALAFVIIIYIIDNILAIK